MVATQHQVAYRQSKQLVEEQDQVKNHAAGTCMLSESVNDAYSTILNVHQQFSVAVSAICVLKV